MMLAFQVVFCFFMFERDLYRCVVPVWVYVGGVWVVLRCVWPLHE